MEKIIVLLHRLFLMSNMKQGYLDRLQKLYRQIGLCGVIPIIAKWKKKSKQTLDGMNG